MLSDRLLQSRFWFSLLLVAIFSNLSLGGVSLFYFETEESIANGYFAESYFALQRSLYSKFSFLEKDPLEEFLLVNDDLPGVSTEMADLFWDQYRQSLVDRDFSSASVKLEAFQSHVSGLLDLQEQLIPFEVSRLNNQLNDILIEADKVLVPEEVYITDLSLIEKTDSSADKFSSLQKLVTSLTREIKKRKVQMDSSVKSIVIDKSDQRLMMFEDQSLVYEMKVSLGQPGKDTRTGEFSILDKINPAWGYYQIWMPYWMGIYFAGSSENGIHGIPWDEAGNRYWVEDAGVRNVTYGCVMPQDEEVAKLFEWVEIGTPITIIN